MAKITKDEYATLPEALKAEFIAEADGYVLKKEDVEGLKNSKEALLQEKKRVTAEAEAMRKRLAEIDAQAAQGEEERLKAAGEFKALEDKLRAKLTETETAAQRAESELLSAIKRERLANELKDRGVKTDRVKYALMELDALTEIERGENGFALKIKNGIGDAKEFDQAVEQLKTTAPFLFGAQTASGGGATGGENGNGGGTATMPRSAFESLSAGERMTFMKSGGQLTD